MVIHINPFSELDSQSIQAQKVNLVSQESIDEIKFIHQYLTELNNPPEQIVIPQWYSDNLIAAIESFNDMFSYVEPERHIKRFSDIYFRGIWSDSNAENPPHRLTLIFLNTWLQTDVNTLKLKSIASLSEIGEDLNNTISVFQSEIDAKNKSFDEVMERLNKTSIEVGVEKFAKIFEDQATADVKTSKNWLIAGFAGLVVLIIVLFASDSIFNIDADFWTPENVLHIASRVLFISLLIFAVSFFFRQYRVNMHLHTLNKHRSNTLKSFEYLTKSPDKLEVQSYNAILMKVAESIYQAGQTGYINGNESSHDVPSIIDMTKIVRDSHS